LRTTARRLGSAQQAANDSIRAPHAGAYRQRIGRAVFRTSAALHAKIRVNNVRFSIFNPENGVGAYIHAHAAPAAAGWIKL
jgi:hypothetical protein